MKTLRAGLYKILEKEHPMTVRQVFYQAVTRGLVGKTELEYNRAVMRLLIELRRGGVIPFEWIVDNTRQVQRLSTHDGVQDALLAAADSYCRSLWSDTREVVAVWLEKDALAGVLWEVVAQYDVPLMVGRGYDSLTFKHDVSELFEAHGRDVFIYLFGDWDPSGKDISRVLERDLREWAPNVKLTFERVAVTEKQIEEWSLPVRPTKHTDPRAKEFKGDSVELDAIPPAELRRLVTESISRHVDQDHLDEIRQTEAEDREALRRIAEDYAGSMNQDP
jgi:hypothetical protein